MDRRNVNDPIVDVIVPVHTDRRPIARGLASVFEGTRTPTRVTVVCHDIASTAIAEVLGDWARDPRVRLLEHRDGVRSPAGPINAGLDAADAEFTSLLGSDDRYGTGAIDAWLRVARRDDAEAVIPTVQMGRGGSLRTPPVRPGRTRRLDGVRDRLAYRTVQLGLIARGRFGTIRMTPGLATGEDVIQGVSIWYSGARVSLARRAPGYLIDVDGQDRTTTTARSASESLRFLDAVLAPSFAEGLTGPQREAFAVKLLRTHLMDVLGAALEAEQLPEDAIAITAAIRSITELAPGARRLVSRRDGRILAALESDQPDVELIATEYARRTDFRRPGNLVSADIRRALAREAPLRFLAAVAFAG